MEVTPTFAEKLSALHPDVHPRCLTFSLAAPAAWNKCCLLRNGFWESLV
jgi:hypothetical protein